MINSQRTSPSVIEPHHSVLRTALMSFAAARRKSVDDEEVAGSVAAATGRLLAAPFAAAMVPMVGDPRAPGLDWLIEGQYDERPLGALERAALRTQLERWDPSRLRDVPLWLPVEEPTFRLGYAGVFAAPVPLDNATGTLVVGRPAGSFSEEEAGILALAGQQLGLLLAYRRLQEEHARERRRRLAGNQFASIVAHDLKTPLTSIRGYAQLLTRRYGAIEDPGALVALQTILHQADSMTQLINDLLDVSRIETERLALRVQPVNLIRIAHETADALRGASQRHQMEVSAAPGVGPVTADPDRLAQVLTNLLNNAVKYSPEDSMVRVRLREQDSGIRVEVQDQGPGVPPDERALVFERFYRSAEASAGQTAGTGLGLFIARAVVEGHGGKIGVESGDGHGSTFWFWLPYEPPRSQWILDAAGGAR